MRVFCNWKTRRGIIVTKKLVVMCITFSLSHVVVQIVDARNPLLFRCEDLVGGPSCVPGMMGSNFFIFLFFGDCQEKYVKEVDSKKVNILLISKADLLTCRQR